MHYLLIHINGYNVKRSGVPQRTILGPMLFPLCTNDLPDAIEHSKIACFADDTKLFKKIDFTSDATSLQRDLNRWEKWSPSLVFNQHKCKCHRVTRKKNPIKHKYKINSKSLVVAEKENDLGIWIIPTIAILRQTRCFVSYVGLQWKLQMSKYAAHSTCQLFAQRLVTPLKSGHHNRLT